MLGPAISSQISINWHKPTVCEPSNLFSIHPLPLHHHHLTDHLARQKLLLQRPLPSQALGKKPLPKSPSWKGQSLLLIQLLNPDNSFLSHPLSPEVPWSPVPPLLGDFNDAFCFEACSQLPDPDCHLLDWPSASTLWSGEDRLSLQWDDECPSLPQPGEDPELPLAASPPTQWIRKSHSFGGFSGLLFPPRKKISCPDYSVWQQPPYEVTHPYARL